MVNFNSMLKQAQVMQEKVAAVQRKIDEHTLEGSSGGGMVKVTISGRSHPKSIKIDPSLVVAEDVEILEDLILAAFRDAQAKATAYSEKEMASVTGGISLPGGLKLPF